ncbi:hypothetical protein [Bosea sp. ANAM02]|nr:hypothetical protein [Bosea sp. ANAM02]
MTALHRIRQVQQRVPQAALRRVLPCSPRLFFLLVHGVPPP